MRAPDAIPRQVATERKEHSHEAMVVGLAPLGRDRVRRRLGASRPVQRPPRISRGGRRVIFTGGKKTIVDGPFAETKELIAGFWLWRVRRMDEALEWALRCPDPMPGEGSALELRPVF